MASKITFEDKITKSIIVEDEIHKITADNVNEIKEVVNQNADEIVLTKYTITTESEISENTDYEIPCNYKVGQDVLDIFYMGERLIKGTHYIEVGTDGTISNKIQFYNWGQSVPIGRTIEFVVRGVYASES